MYVQYYNTPESESEGGSNSVVKIVKQKLFSYAGFRFTTIESI